MSGKNVGELVMVSPFVRFNESFRPMSPFPTVAPSDRGSPPTGGTMRTLRRLSSRFGLLRLSLVSRYLAVSLLFCVMRGLRDTSPLTTGSIGHPALPHGLTGNSQQGVDRPPRFLNQPCVHMPRSQTPAGSTYHRHGVPSSAAFRVLASRRLPTTIHHFRIP